MGVYRVAQICTNGHLITTTANTTPEKRENFCSKCGAETITHCPTCEEFIRGYYHRENVIGNTSRNYKVPDFCHNCGVPYPWTESSIQAIKELMEFEEDLTEEEKEIITKNFDDLIKETPRTRVAALKTKSLLAKATEGTKQAFRDIAIDIVSEVAKKSLFG